MKASWRVTLVCIVTLGLSACTFGRQDEPAAQQREVTVVSLLPKRADQREQVAAMVAGIEAAIEARGRIAGGHRIRYVDSDSTSPDFAMEVGEEECRDLARQYANDAQVVAVIGPLGPQCAGSLVPGLNQAGVLVVGPTESLPGLTHQVPGPGSQDDNACYACSPTQFYPTGTRNYARVVSTFDTEGAAAVGLLQQLGAKRVYALTDTDAFQTAWMIRGFAQEAKRRGIEVVATERYDFKAKSFAPEVRALVASGADAVYLMAPVWNSGVRVLDAVRAGGFRGQVVSSLSIVDASLLHAPGGAAEGAYFTSARLPVEALPADAKRFATSIGAGEFGGDAIYAAEAANLVLDAIAKSDGTRPGVRQAAFGLSRTGLLGPITIDANGDAQPQRIAVFRARDGAFRYRETITIR